MNNKRLVEVKGIFYVIYADLGEIFQNFQENIKKNVE